MPRGLWGRKATPWNNQRRLAKAVCSAPSPMFQIVRSGQFEARFQLHYRPPGLHGTTRGKSNYRRSQKWHCWHRQRQKSGYSANSWSPNRSRHPPPEWSAHSAGVQFPPDDERLRSTALHLEIHQPCPLFLIAIAPDFGVVRAHGKREAGFFAQGIGPPQAGPRGGVRRSIVIRRRRGPHKINPALTLVGVLPNTRRKPHFRSVIRRPATVAG